MKAALRKLLCLSVVTLLPTLTSCGPDTSLTGLTVSSLEYSSNTAGIHGQEIGETEDWVLDDATFDVEFSEAPAGNTVNSDTVTLTCDDTPITLTIASQADVDGSDKRFSINLPTGSNDATLEGYSTCIMTFDIWITDVSGNAMPEATTFTFSVLPRLAKLL